jgi:hypothetical protein
MEFWQRAYERKSAAFALECGMKKPRSLSYLREFRKIKRPRAKTRSGRCARQRRACR